MFVHHLNVLCVKYKKCSLLQAYLKQCKAVCHQPVIMVLITLCLKIVMINTKLINGEQTRAVKFEVNWQIPVMSDLFCYRSVFQHNCILCDSDSVYKIYVNTSTTCHHKLLVYIYIYIYIYI